MMEGKVGYAFVYCRAFVSINAMFLQYTIGRLWSRSDGLGGVAAVGKL